MRTVKREIRRTFNRMGMLGFDEINALSVKKETTAAYDALKSLNQREFLKIAQTAYGKAEKEAEKAGFSPGKTEKKRRFSKAWLLAVLGAYNLVTGYLYEQEAERKRLRTAEALLTAEAYHSRSAYRDALQLAADLWYTQSAQYADTVTDAAVLEAYRACGVETVRWVTAEDGKVCETCLERYGETYRIDKIPAKPHYRCRCYVLPVAK
ncbi:MAG: hypothetical protein PUJ35_04825 [Ruminococcus bromii]|nr:hypothetical protein [Ruminococcus bromii]